MVRETKYCSECKKQCGRRGGSRYGFTLCGRCIKKSSLPNLFLKTHPKFDEWNEKHKLKRTKGFRNLKWHEKQFLYQKHIKKGESEEAAKLSIANLQNMVRNHAYEQKEEDNFKDQFDELVQKRRKN